MATRKAKAATPVIKAKPVSSMVKKDLASIRTQAASLKAFLKDPGVAAIRVCECCIQVS